MKKVLQKWSNLQERSGCCENDFLVPEFFLVKWINSWTNFFQNFKSVQMYMKDAKCAETNKKSIFSFLRFLVFEIWTSLYWKLVNFSMIFQYKIDHN